MSIMRIVSAVALLTVLATAPARAAEPLQPTAKWNVDFGDAHCIAMRSYGPPDRPITLALKPSPIGDVMQLSVLRVNASKIVDQYEGALTIDRQPPVKVSMLGYAAAAGKTRVSMINLPLATYQPIRSASSLRVQSSGVDATFALSQMEPVARALDNCVAGLRKAWNITDAAKDIGPSANPKKPLVSYFDGTDYPAVAARGEATGTVALVMLVDEAGKIASCMVTQSSGYASLDAQSCAILTARAKFDPVVVDGKPVKSGRTYRIRWALP
ncbi:MAG: energy transducer TonB [Sphingomonas bacterium]|nr:energy transducer TonB [Sphingomonas bacterium]